MAKVELGAAVLYRGVRGRVTATSGTDETCVVKFPSGVSTAWVPMSEVEVLGPGPAASP